MKTMVSPEMLEKSENTMFELAELIDVNKEISDSLATQQVVTNLNPFQIRKNDSIHKNGAQIDIN